MKQTGTLVPILCGTSSDAEILFHNLLLRASISWLLPLLLLLSVLAVKADQYGDFGYTTNGGSVTITNYSGPGGAVAIPSTINDLPVTSIGDDAFADSSLTSVTIPDGVTSIGNEAFFQCTGLTSVTIPSSVTSIGSFAFHYCRSLTSVTIPNSVTNIGDRAFLLCSSMTAITVDGLNSIYGSMDGVLFNDGQTTLIQYPGGKGGSYTIPNNVTSIGDWAFSYCNSLTGVTIPSSVTNIGGAAFERCMSLTNVTIPDNVTSIGDGAFYWCWNLTSVTIGNSVTDIGGGAFQQCWNLTNVTIPNSVTSLGDYAFFNCNSLTSVTIGNNVTNIGDWAFSYCNSLTGIYFQGNAPSIGSSVFDSTDATVYYLPGTTGWDHWVSPPPAVLWNPQFQVNDASFGVRTNKFGFTITGTTNIPIVLEACTNLASPAWVPLQSCTLTNGSLYFSDPDWTNYPSRFYRIRSP